jgi:5-methylcytosine-specific restriction endonuclease McrA
VLRLCTRCEQGFQAGDLKQGRCADCRREHERERNASNPRRRVRNLAKWQRTRELVKRRDGFACVGCGATEPLEIHHKIKLRFVANPYDLSNLETLCLSCHRKKDRRLVA